MARQIAEAKRRALVSQASRAVQENPYLVSDMKCCREAQFLT